MSPEIDPLFPEGISDETAVALHAFLRALALACESRYLAQLMRYNRAQRNLYDPDEPWRSPLAVPPSKPRKR